MNQVSIALAVVVLVAMVTFGNCQTSINCYACQGTFNPSTGVYSGCDQPFNTTQMQTVTCYGVCVKAIQFNPTVSTTGSFDTVTRGCTTTQPRLGCYSSEHVSPTTVTCVSTCSSSLCNSADGLRATAAITIGLLSTLAAVFFRS